MKDFTPTSYTLECVATGREFPDEGWTLDDAQCKCPSLIRTRYAKKQLELKSDEYGFYKFADWLPVRRMLENSKAPVTYKSKGLTTGFRCSCRCLPTTSMPCGSTDRWILA